jgi:hypothetical protein
VYEVQSVPPVTCPSSLTQSGFVNDLGLLADAVSWEDSSIVEGICGKYKQIHEQHGMFDTRLRVYRAQNGSDIIFSFRPTQQSPEGGDIHNERRLSACRFLNGSCYGMVNDRFQQAFQDLVRDLDENVISNLKINQVSTVGHSLGGSLQLFMAVYLFEKYNIQPHYVLGFAGPFIGDKVFTDTYIAPLKEAVGENMWQVETIDISNPNNFDGTVEGYNVNNGDGAPNWGLRPFNPLSPWYPPISDNVIIKTPIFIDETDLCGLEITPLQDSYGMHDLKNYRIALIGKEC